MLRKPIQRQNARTLLALNMKRLRAKYGWSQDTLGLEAGLDRTFVAHVERLRRNISLDNVEKIAVALLVSIQELFAPEVDRGRGAPGRQTSGGD